MVREYGARRGAADDVWCERRVSQTAGNQPQPDHSTTSRPHDGVHPDGAAGEDSQNCSRREREDRRNSGRLVHGGRPVAIQNLGPHQKELVASSREPMSTATLGTLIQKALRDIKEPGALHRFLSVTAIEGRHRDAGGTSRSLLHDTGGTAGDDSRQPPQPTRQTVRQHGPQTHAQPATSRTQATSWTGKALGRAPEKSVMNLIMLAQNIHFAGVPSLFLRSCARRIHKVSRPCETKRE